MLYLCVVTKEFAMFCVCVCGRMICELVIKSVVVESGMICCFIGRQGVCCATCDQRIGCDLDER